MPRYRLTIEYDGRPYNGFQAQASQPSVQGAIEAAVKAFSGQAIRIAAAGRTDTGVHATGQVVHVDLERDWPAETVMNALNAHLVREAVSVLDAVVVSNDWHARFSANERRYLYRILNRRPRRPWRRARSGTSRSRSTPRPCTRPPRPWWACTTSPPSATWPARPNRR
jgi:tRNA pseudouridine38-40 synthase